jgi:hypothetical protein
MLFDIRGRRRHVIRVVYAILALLMGASLFLVVGPFNLADLVGTGSTTNASKVLDEQAERIETRLVREPDNEALLVSLARTRIAAGNAQTETIPETGAVILTPEGRADVERAVEAWTRYVKEADSPNPSPALLVASAYFTLAESSTNFEDIVASINGAASAQRIAVDGRPNLGSLSTLAIYEYYAGNFAAGDKAAKKAEDLAATKAEAQEVKKQMGEFRQRGKAFQSQRKEIAKAERSQGKEALQNPFGGLGGSTGSLGE